MVGRSHGPDSTGRGLLHRTSLAPRLAALALALVGRAAAGEPLEVVVRGDSIAAPPKDPSVAGSVIGEERLRAPGLQASDVLRTQPGVVVLETGGHGSLSTASIRGATAAQTPVYLAGIRLNDDVGGTTDLSLLPLFLIQRIEVYRSNAPIYGDQLGLAGAIFFEVRRAKTIEAGGGAMAGSYGAHAIWGRAGVGDDAAGALVAVRLEGAANDYTYLNDGGTRFERSNDRTFVHTNSDTRTADVWATGSTRVGREGRVDLVANDVEREQGLPGLSLFPSTHARLRQSRRLVGLTSRVPCSEQMCEATATTAAVLTRAIYDDPYREVALGATELDVDARRIDESLLVRFHLSDRVSITPALRASVESMTLAASKVTTAHTRRVFSRAALQAEWWLSDAIALRALGSAECHGTSLDGTPPWFLPGDATGPRGSESCNQFQPAMRAGAQWGRAPLAFLATVGRYARVPTLTELYGMSGAVRGNGALEPETGICAEAGVRAATSSSDRLRDFAIDIFGFVRQASRLVAYQRSSLGYVRPFNVGSARVAGLEILASYRPAPIALFELAVTLLDPKNTSSSRPANDVIPYQPRIALVPRAEVASKLGFYPVDSGKLSLLYFYQSSRYADPAGLVVIPEQGSLELEGMLGALGGHLTLRGRLANLLNQARSDLIGYPLPGRAAYAALEAQW